MISPLIIQGSIKLIGFSLGLLCRRMCNRQSVEIKICERPKKGTHVGLFWNAFVANACPFIQQKVVKRTMSTET